MSLSTVIPSTGKQPIEFSPLDLLDPNLKFIIDFITNSTRLRTKSDYAFISTFIDGFQHFCSLSAQKPESLSNISTVPLQFTLCSQRIVNMNQFLFKEETDEPIFDSNPLFRSLNIKCVQGHTIRIENAYIGSLCVGNCSTPTNEQTAIDSILSDMSVLLTDVIKRKHTLTAKNFYQLKEQLATK